MSFRFLYSVAVSLCLSAAVLSCTSSSEPLPDISNPVTFSGNKLKLTYCGELMPAKIMKVNQSGEEAIDIMAQGITNLNALSQFGFNGMGAAPGILPGSPFISLKCPVKTSGSKYLFEGNGKTDYCENFIYSGFLEGDSLIFNIEKVSLANNLLSGSIWTPVPFKQSGLVVDSTPFHLLWEIDPSSQIDIDLTALLETLVTIPIIPTYQDTAYSSISQLLSLALQTIAFNEDGNIFVRYFSSVGGATQLVTSTGNTLQYVVLNDRFIKLYPNPTSLFGLWLVGQSDSDLTHIDWVHTKSNEESISSDTSILLPILKSLLPSILEMTKDGIPIEMALTNNSLDLFLNTEVILSLLQQIAEAINENPEVFMKFLGLASDNPMIAELLPQLQKLLPRIDEVLKATTKIQIGLSFNKFPQ